MMLTIAPAARLIQSETLPDARISSACEPGMFASKSDFHHSRLIGPRKGQVIEPNGPWKERIPIRIIGA